MPIKSRKSPLVRRGRVADLDDLCRLDRLVFKHNCMSRRSLRHLLVARSAHVVVAEHDGHISGWAVVLFRSASWIARLYSIAVAPRGYGLGPALLVAAEVAALARERHTLRLEVHVRNHHAIARYRKAGYQQCGRLKGYYADNADALRFEKQLAKPKSRNRRS